ncbi:hypothetical protein H0901_06730 [Microcystis aeruginosa BLCCF158]|uniref:Uncharacterized protein n=1 Tax=Microcystis aeruginosa BLCC-F158 TaxID=2755316 RepID=A0A841UYA3_MICAE|nr:hypothetical protein [Microcystis aeruginosa]MBC1194985.1 hypothetical protein [Microcystis aeruginosa BLCC-F158]
MLSRLAYCQKPCLTKFPAIKLTLAMIPLSDRTSWQKFIIIRPLAIAIGE